jgi:peptidoglycan-associated lipoprotein
MNATRPVLFLSFVALLALSACSSTPTNNAAGASTASQSPSRPLASSSGQQPASTVAGVKAPGADGKSLASQRSVYFDFDDYSVKSEFAPVVADNGKALSANPKLAVQIIGNADERGSAEYNLALGQKRAEAVARALKIYGVKDTQMEAISWGKEKPKASGHDETAWAQNRRADIDYPKR